MSIQRAVLFRTDVRADQSQQRIKLSNLQGRRQMDTHEVTQSPEEKRGLHRACGCRRFRVVYTGTARG